ncbi:MAG: VanZ family protein [Terriglobia bacterium]
MPKLLRYWLPVIAWAALILTLSTGAFQHGRTLPLLRSLLQFLIPDLSPATLALLHTLLRKGVHMAEYFVLGFLLWRAFRADATARWRPRWSLAALALSLALAALDELHQSFEPTRTGALLDVGIDTAGAALAQLWLWWRARLPSPPTTRPP